MEAEKTKEGPLIRWWSTTVREPAQKPPAEASPVAQEPRSMSTLEACRWEGVRLENDIGRTSTYGNIVQFCQTTTCPTNGTEGVCLIEDQTVFILVLELNLKKKERISISTKFLPQELI